MFDVIVSRIGLKWSTSNSKGATGPIRDRSHDIDHIGHRDKIKGQTLKSLRKSYSCAGDGTFQPVFFMVLILDGNSEQVAHA